MGKGTLCPMTDPRNKAVFDVSEAVPDLASDVELVIQDPGAALTVSVDR